MMKSFLGSYLFLLPAIFMAQTKIPYNHTPNGEVVFDTYDSFLNEEYRGLNFYLEADYAVYEKGTYYLKNESNGIPALIWMQNEDKLKVKKQPYGIYAKVDMSNLDAYVTKVDSFFVTNNIRLKDRAIEKPTILQYLGATKQADFAMYYKIKTGSVLEKKILQLKKTESQQWEELELNGEDPKRIYVLLGFHDKVNNLYDKQELTINDFLNSLKIEEYFKHYKNNTNIMYDALWREIKKPKQAVYYGNVTNVVDSIFTLEISNRKGQKLYDLNYSSLYPLKRHGKFVAYDGNQIKMERTYEYGDLLSSKIFKEGELVFHFDYFKFKKLNKSDILKRRAFKLGSKTIETFGKEVASITDFDGLLNYEIDKKNIISSYQETPTGRLYHYSNFENPIDFGAFTASLRGFLESSRYYNNTILSQDFEGSMSLQIVTDHKGKVLNYTVMECNNDLLENTVSPFYDSHLTAEGNRSLRFKEIKLENKTDRCTFILPINFEHRQFYKTFSRPNNSNWLWQWQFQQQMMWQQQLMNQQVINNIPRF